MPNATRCNAQMLSKFGSNFIPPSLFVILLHLTQNGHSTPHNTHTHIDRGWDVGLRVLTLVG